MDEDRRGIDPRLAERPPRGLLDRELPGAPIELTSRRGRRSHRGSGERRARQRAGRARIEQHELAQQRIALHRHAAVVDAAGQHTVRMNREALIADVYNALRANDAVWQRTLLVITFDEHGGTYDHVDPGWGAVTPDQYRGPDGFAFDRYGVRVTTLLISPWVSAGTVFRSPSSTLKFDHTSIIATILALARDS